jgi:MFS family permease
MRLAGAVSSLARGPNTRLLVYMLAVQLAVWMSAPYFTPFMLTHLKLSYGGFTVLICASLVVKVLCLPMLGRFCRKWGVNRTLWSSGSLIACVPALWILDGGYLYLLILQIVAGAIWAAFELAMLLAFFESIPKHQRLGLLTIFNVANAAAIALGAVVGGAVLSFFESGRGAYYVLFALSTAARLMPLLLLVKMPHLKLRTWFMATRSIAVRPSMGTIERPVLASLPAAVETSPTEAGNVPGGHAPPDTAEPPREFASSLFIADDAPSPCDARSPCVTRISPTANRALTDSPRSVAVDADSRA